MVVLDGVEQGGDQERVVDQKGENEAEILQQDGVVRALGREARALDLGLQRRGKTINELFEWESNPRLAEPNISLFWSLKIWT